MLLPHKRTFPIPTLTQKLFSNMKRASKGYSRVDIPLFSTMLTTPESSPSRITSSPSLSPQTHSSTSQPPSTLPSNQTTPVIGEAALIPYESPLQSVYSLGGDEDSLSRNELTNLFTLLSKKVESLESELKQTKQTYNADLTKLIKRVKKLEKTIKTSQARRRAKVVISDDEEVEEDPSNQERSLIEELDLDAGIYLVPPHTADRGRFDETHISDQPEEQLGVFSAATALADAARRRRSVENVQTYIRRRREVSAGSGGVSIASSLVSTADISIVSELDSTAAKKVFEEEQAKFNAEPEARFKAKQEQERIDFETALELGIQGDDEPNRSIIGILFKVKALNPLTVLHQNGLGHKQTDRDKHILLRGLTAPYNILVFFEDQLATFHLSIEAPPEVARIGVFTSPHNQH
ncbi:hypothetical protein Tco_0294124 [Tanacetum coccineum]